MKRLVACLLSLGVLASACAQELKLPAEIKGAAGAWIIVAPEVISGGKPKWRIDPGLQEVRLDLLLPPEVLGSLRGKVLQASPGRYRVEVWNAKDDVASDIVTCWILIGDQPLPPPGPGPNPPPPAPTPVPLAGMRVLFLYETAPPVESRDTMRKFQTTMNSSAMREYLAQKCLRGPQNTPEWRAYDQDDPLTSMPQAWRDLRSKAVITVIPWVIIEGDSSVGVVFSGPSPIEEASLLTLLKKYGG
jgi:hypothetical protein